VLSSVLVRIVQINSLARSTLPSRMLAKSRSAGLVVVTTPSDLQMEDWAHQTLGLGSYPAEFSALTTEQALDTFQQLLCDVAPGLGEGLAQECPELIAPSGEPKLMSLTPTGMHLVSAKQEICESPVMPPRQRLIQTAALPMSAFTPLAKEEGTSQQSNPLYTLHILKEPPPEVTKMVIPFV